MFKLTGYVKKFSVNGKLWDTTEIHWQYDTLAEAVRDVRHEYEALISLPRELVMPGCVASYKVTDGEGTVVWTFEFNTDNFNVKATN